ncbi:hypothetical protein K435DRAFT_972534 [Dendrothele bispora CBS 962.96]|uniref:Uncharacterized protein n=1 Tax=Dendrothele bispora (strain CBS 962.96) TaxID=1314807 RepID=A0A4S8KYM3_DENBC|nr:hypothetical protein K435DRAFT_972534 [Dendrothele bispora CBS 962.96]
MSLMPSRLSPRVLFTFTRIGKESVSSSELADLLLLGWKLKLPQIRLLPVRRMPAHSAEDYGKNAAITDVFLKHLTVDHGKRGIEQSFLSRLEDLDLRIHAPREAVNVPIAGLQMLDTLGADGLEYNLTVEALADEEPIMYGEPDYSNDTEFSV